MRNMSLLLITAALAGCSTAPQPLGRSAEAEAHLQGLLAGRIAGQPVSCLSTFRANNMVTIDDNTIIFRDGARVYRNEIQGGCSRLATGHYALVTKSYGSSGLCRGDIARVTDVGNGMVVGTCVLGDFVPYTRTGT